MDVKKAIRLEKMKGLQLVVEKGKGWVRMWELESVLKLEVVMGKELGQWLELRLDLWLALELDN